MSVRYLNPIIQASDNGGAAVAGALLYFYESGSPTKADTYSDDARTTANSNPVVADGNGRFGDIFLQPIDYLVKFHDAADDQLSPDQDPVSGRESGVGLNPVFTFFYPLDPAVDVGSETLGSFGPTQNFLLPADLTGSRATLGTAPTAATQFIIKNNGSSIGTINFAIGATTATFTFASNVLLTNTDNLTIINQPITDITAADLTVSLQNSQISGAILSVYAADFYSDIGTATAYDLTPTGLTIAPPSYGEGLSVSFTASNTSTGAATILIQGLDVIPLTIAGAALIAGDITAGDYISARYKSSGNYFYITSILRTDAPVNPELYAVDDVYLTTKNHGSAAAVALHFGYGTWVEDWEGLGLFGVGSNTDTVGENYSLSAGVEFGSKNHELVEAENGPHTHTYTKTITGSSYGDNSTNQADSTATTSSSGAGDPHENMPPGKALYVWRRTT